MTQSKLSIKNSKLFYMYVALLMQVVQTPSSSFEMIPKDVPVGVVSPRNILRGI